MLGIVAGNSYISYTEVKGDFQMARTLTKTNTMIGFAARGTAKERRAAIVARAEGVVRALGRRVTPDDLRLGLEALERALEPQRAGDNTRSETNGASNNEAETKRALVDQLTDGRTYNARARAELEFANLQRGFEARRTLLEGALTAAQVSALLGSKTRQTAHDRREAGTLLAVQDNGVWKFPLWQFDPNGPDGVVAGLPETLRALNESGLASPLHQASFLMQPSPYLSGRTALAALRDGDADDVMALARGVGAS